MQKVFEKIIEKLKEKKTHETFCDKEVGFNKGIRMSIEIVNQVAEEYVPEINVGNIALDAWEILYKRILQLEKEYFEAGDVANSDKVICLLNLLRHYKEQITEESWLNSEEINQDLNNNNQSLINDWIPCSERLPEKSGEYLVTYHPCYWDSVQDGVKVGIDTFRGKTTWARNKYQKVIAWKTLPEAYIEKMGV